MKEIAAASINTFGPVPKVEVSPSEPIFVLTAGQLKEIISQAIQPLQDEVMELKATIACQNEKIRSLEAMQEAEISRVCVDIAQDRRRLAALEKVEPQPLQKDRGEILRALITANGGKMLAKEARAKMHLSNQTFSMLLASMSEYIETKPLHSDKRKLILFIK